MSENKENFEKEIQENENSTDIEKHLELVEDQDVNEENVINAEEEAKEKLEEENLKDKLFYSGVIYDKSDDGISVIRTKERMEIIKIENYKYQLTRTYEVIKFP